MIQELPAVNCEIQIALFPAAGNGPAAGEIMVVEESPAFALQTMECLLLAVKCVCWLERNAVRRLEYVRLVSKRKTNLLIWYGMI